MISRDEGLHTDFACLLYKYLNKKLNQNQIYEMINEAVNGEIVEFKAHLKLADRIEDFYKQKFLKGYFVPAEFLDKFRIT